MIISNNKIIASINDTGPTDGLVAWWTMNGHLKDVSGNGNDGVHSGTPLYVDAIPDGGKGLNFNGTSDAVGCGNNESLNFGENSFSFFTWLYIVGHNLTDDRWCFIHKRNGWQGYRMDVRGNVFNIQIGDAVDSGRSVSSITPLQNNKWYHAGFIVNKVTGRVYIYLNGIGDGEYSYNEGSVSNSGNLSLGSLYTNVGQFSGIMDDVRIYNRALSDKEIKLLARSFKQ